MFHLNLHSALAIKRSVRPLWNGPIGTASRGMMGFSETMGNIFHGSSACCLHPDTKFQVYTDHDILISKEISSLSIGDRVIGQDGDTEVTGMVIALRNQDQLYQYKDVICTDNHYIYHDGDFQPARHVAIRMPHHQNVPKVYCPLTRSHTIVSQDGVCLLDYDETEDETLDKSHLGMILTRLLPHQKVNIENFLHSVYYDHDYTYWNTVGVSNPGISGNTMLIHETTKEKTKEAPIRSLQVGQYLSASKIQAIMKFVCVDDFVYQHRSGIYATGRQMIQIRPEDWHYPHCSWIKWLPVGLAYLIQAAPDWKKVSLPKKDMLFYNVWIGQGILISPDKLGPNIEMLDMMDGIDSEYASFIYRR